MRLLFDDLLEIYRRYRDKVLFDGEWDSADNPYFGNVEAYDEDDKALTELEEVIVKILAPESVGQVMNLPESGLQMTGLIYLIEKDASDEYDDIEGYVDAALWTVTEETLTPAQYEFNGLDLCRWIDQNFPVEAVA